MHGHQLQVKLWRDHTTRSTRLRKQLQAGDRGVGPCKVDPHEPGKQHSGKSGDQGQCVILLADHLMIQTEDVFPNETCRRSVVLHRVRRYVVHLLSPQKRCLIRPRMNADGKSYCDAACFFSQSLKSSWDNTLRYAFML